MSFFDDASLVMIPSGYKTSKVYSVKPTDGSGDLTFTRSNDTATRVASNGLIEKVRTNLSFYSQQLDNGFWVKLGTGLTVTANTTIAPDGTLTADTLNVSNNDNVLYASRATALAGNEFTFSIYVKGTGTFSMNIRLNSVTTTTETKTLTSDWQRFSVSVTNAAPVTSVEFFLGLNTSSTYSVWAAQVESSPVATAYIATTSAAVSVGPVANVPRLDYTDSTCPRLLLEPQRTNNALYSEQLDNAAWTKQNTTVTANVVTSPSGYQDADKLVETSGTGAHRASVSSAATLNGTFSFFAKAGERTKVAILSTTIDLGFDLSNGTLIDLGTGTSAGKIENYGNGWYRCSLPQASGIVALYLALLDNANNISYTGNGTSGAYFWGAQLEVGAYATSYIPTLGSASTRGSDAAYKASISTLIGQTEGVAFIDFVWNGLTGEGSYPRVIELWGDSNNYIQLFTVSGSANVYWDLYVGGAAQASGSAAMALGRNKIAVAYKTNDFAFYKNGTLIASDTSCTVPATSSLGIAGSYAGSAAQLAASVNQALLFPTRLTNAQLAELTTI
jgi:hypothetical protein